MAIPWDPTQHIQGISAGVKDAMPGIQAAVESGQSGDANIEAFLNEYTRRREAGEPAESITTDLLGMLKSGKSPLQQPQFNNQVPTVGVQDGRPALGPQGGLNTPLSQPAQGSFNPSVSGQQQPQQGLQAAASQPIQQFQSGAVNQPTGINAMGGGFGGNTIRGVTPADALAMQQRNAIGAKAPEPTYADSVGDYTDAMGAIGVDAKDANAMLQVKTGTAAPISLNRKPAAMETAVNQSPMPKYRTRGEQDREMANIAKIESMDSKRAGLNMKALKQEQDSQLKAIKSMIDLRKNDATFMAKVEELALRTKGMDAEQQRFVVGQFLLAEQNAAKNQLYSERTRVAGISASRPRAGDNKMPPQLRDLRDRYFEARGKIGQAHNGGFARTNPGLMAQHKADEKKAREDFNKMAQSMGWPPIDENGKIPDTYMQEPEPDFGPE